MGLPRQEESVGRPRLISRIAERFMRRLASGSWQAGQALPATRTLAKEFAVALGTMQAALREVADKGMLQIRQRRPTLVCPDAVERARALLAELATRPASRRLAILVPDRFLPLPPVSTYGQLIDLVMPAADRKDIECAVVPWPLRDQVPAVQSFVHHDYGAALCVGVTEAYLVPLTVLYEQRFPVVLFNRRFPDLHLPTVRHDDDGAMRRITDHLIGFGHRRIRLVTPHDPTVMRSQMNWITNWIRYVDEKGLLDVGDLPVCYVPPAGDPVRFVRRILRSPAQTTALIMGSGSVTDVVCAAAEAEGLRIPDSLSVATFGSGARMPHTVSHQPLTTIASDLGRMAQCLVETVDRMLGGNLYPPSIRVPLQIHLTGSIGPPPRV